MARRDTNDCRLPPHALAWSPPPFILYDPTTECFGRLDAFAMRQFNDPDYTGTKVEYDPQEFENKVRHIVQHVHTVDTTRYITPPGHVFTAWLLRKTRMIPKPKRNIFDNTSTPTLALVGTGTLLAVGVVEAWKSVLRGVLSCVVHGWLLWSCL